MENFSRTIRLIGEQHYLKLKNSHVIIFGIGGVGGYVCEALVRSGIENFTLVDFDSISISNLNRQIIALTSNIGEFKVEAMKKRMLDINPTCKIQAINLKIDKSNIDAINFTTADYIVDAIDMVSSKLVIIEMATRNNVNIISCMGTGNKLNPTMFCIDDIYKTSTCPLARVIRQELKKRNIPKLTVLYSKEQPIKQNVEKGLKKQTPASISYVPSVAGLLIAHKVCNDIMGDLGGKI